MQLVYEPPKKPTPFAYLPDYMGNPALAIWEFADNYYMLPDGDGRDPEDVASFGAYFLTLRELSQALDIGLNIEQNAKSAAEEILHPLVDKVSLDRKQGEKLLTEIIIKHCRK